MPAVLSPAGQTKLTSAVEWLDQARGDAAQHTDNCREALDAYPFRLPNGEPTKALVKRLQNLEDLIDVLRDDLRRLA